SEGSFAWETVPGFYEVRASKPGCGTATSAVLQLPPPATELKLVLHCTNVLKVETESLPAATRGTPYSAKLEAFGGTGPYKFAKVGVLPKGLKLSAAGALTGTPSTKLAPGDYAVEVSVTDSAKPTKATATRTLTLTIQ